MRSLHKVFQTDRPLKPNSRRAKFYEAGSSRQYRIEFMDEYGVVNQFYNTKDEAEAAYQAFKDDKFSTLDVRDEKGE